MATFTMSRWAQIVELFDEIDQSVAKLVDGQQKVKLQFRVGAGCYVSVITGSRCVNMRKFYGLTRVGVRPTKSGIALRLSQ
jgi:hypothetical protein